MADELILRHSGIDKVQAALANFAGDLRKTVRGGLRKASRPLAVEAQANAPVLARPVRRRAAGTLKRNIKIFNSKKANGQGGRLGVYVSVKASRKDLRKAPVTGDPYYWRWVEGGHLIVPKFKGKYTDYKRRGRGRLTGLTARRAAATRRVAPREFLLRAYRTKAQGTIGLFTDDVLARVAKFNATR